MSKEKKVSFDTIRGKEITDIHFFKEMNCFGRCPSEMVAYHQWNVRNPQNKRSYYSSTVPAFYYLMDSMGQRWARYKVDLQYTHDKAFTDSLYIIAAISQKTQKDLENDRIDAFSIFESPHLFLIRDNYWTKTYQVKNVDLKNIPHHILPEQYCPIGCIAQNEISLLTELIELKTKGRLTFEYVRSYRDPGFPEYERIEIVNPKIDGNLVKQQSYYGTQYNVSQNQLSLGYDNEQKSYQYINL